MERQKRSNIKLSSCSSNIWVSLNTLNWTGIWWQNGYLHHSWKCITKGHINNIGTLSQHTSLHGIADPFTHLLFDFDDLVVLPVTANAAKSSKSEEGSIMPDYQPTIKTQMRLVTANTYNSYTKRYNCSGSFGSVPFLVPGIPWRMQIVSLSPRRTWQWSFSILILCITDCSPLVWS